MSDPDSWRPSLEALARSLDGHVAHLEVFPARTDQAAGIRQVVRTTVGRHPESDTIVLLANELVGNAVLHSGSAVLGLVVATMPDGGLRVAVADQNRTDFPHPLEATDHRDDIDGYGEHGRGLLLLDHLAVRWGIVRKPGLGLAIWFDII